MVASSFIKIFSIVVLAALAVSAQRECPSVQVEDNNNAEKKRFIVMFNKEVKNAAEDHYETLKECYKISVQNILKVDEADEADDTVFDPSVIRDFSVDGSIQGYTSYFTPEFAEAVGKMKNVELVEEERKGEADKISLRFSRRFSRRYNRRAEDDFPPRSLDRIDQAKRPLDKKFVFPDSAGEGVNIFIIDSGILLTHDEFNGRAKFGRSFCKGCKRENIMFHGTFVASTAAGKTLGVARKANLIDVRVMDAKGDFITSDVIESLSYVIDQHKNGKNKNSVVNISLHVIPPSKAVNLAVKELTDAGIHIAVSAGNFNKDACGQSPASAPSAITVGATDDKTDKVTVFSNFGKCVDIFAPGSNLLGAGVNGDDDYLISSGTSFSSPMVAGTLALLISKNGNKSPADLAKDLIDLSSKGVISGLLHGSPDAFLRIPAP